MRDSVDETLDAIARERIRVAQAMSPGDRLLAGPRLFDYACRIALDGIRGQFPAACGVEVARILRRRLESARRLEQN